jgi:uncharacterized integral membrane protein (TIGR00698 family)
MTSGGFTPRKGLFCLLALVTLWPVVPAGAAIVAGIAVAMILGNPLREECGKLAPKLLSYSIIGLGAAMDLRRVGEAGLHGLGYTAVGIGVALLLGRVLGKVLKTDDDTSLLVSVGTAICGGSAIAAVAVAIRARASEVTVAMVTVFLLNALAILIFPPIGHRFGLDEVQFGLWSALAIHDTSSVVGAAMQYGPKALEIGTTVKLARALWIIPVSIGVGLLRARKEDAAEAGKKAKRPWFILGFLTTAALVTFIPALAPAGEWVAAAARRLLVLTLFLIGAGLTMDRLKQVGFRPFLQGVVLWLVMASATLAAILSGWVT